jgi:hypothetical protein
MDRRAGTSPAAAAGSQRVKASRNSYIAAGTSYARPPWCTKPSDLPLQPDRRATAPGRALPPARASGTPIARQRRRMVFPNPTEVAMKVKAACIGIALCFAAGSAVAAGDKKDTTGMKKDTMSMQECKDYMANKGKSGMKDDAKKDAMCADMAKKDEHMKGGTTSGTKK